MRSILLVIGSLRKNSFNRQLAQVISSELAGKATVSTRAIAYEKSSEQDSCKLTSPL
ncbi:NAD(P)H-dependent oxidoreductase [Pyramidobacter piscolens]|uniref:NAD(P)H-dependent oxidoreductase n=1 Tax=Pyramidobacter piscolens TaxID=638849 RepID=UPI001FCC239B|nr:NAD(P)H-dependent oxidoreductase [Pyramidobacter piscolens]BDF78280.1 hypothetical protein CE91St28_10740 [Pyramidobacter piscolens]